MSTSPDVTREPTSADESRRRTEGEERAKHLREQATRVRESRSEDVEPGPHESRSTIGTSGRGGKMTMQERVDQARAQQAISNVNDRGWWDRASVHDLQAAQSIANAPGTSATARTAINARMEEVSQNRYGTNLDGAMRYEAQHPNQAPPDVRTTPSARSM